MKCDTSHKSSLYWFEEDYYPSEPMFVSRPGATDEDDGLVISAVVSEVKENEGFLLVLDGQSFKEVARANFTTPSALPAGFHGYFLNKSS